jgi:U4/U6 small nuclear ribonucleoprotein PRP31
MKMRMGIWKSSLRMGIVPEGGVRPAEELDEAEVEKADMTGVEDVGKVAKLAGGRKLRDIMAVS